MALTVYTAGEVLTAQSLNDNLAFAAANPTAPAVAIFNETQANNTAGGTATSGSYAKRTLNTTVVNTITGCSIAASVITLAAGTYEVFATAPAFSVDSHKIRLQNTTAATTIAIGSSMYTDSGNSVATNSVIQTSFVLAASTNIEVQHRVGSTKASNGFGVETNFSDDEIYTQIKITKVA